MSLISADNQRIVSGSGDKTVRVWDIETGEELKVLKGDNAVTSIAISTDSRRIVSGSDDNTICVWDMETGEKLKVLQGHEDLITSLVISAPSKRIISGSFDGTVRVWDIETSEELKGSERCLPCDERCYQHRQSANCKQFIRWNSSYLGYGNR